MKKEEMVKEIVQIVNKVFTSVEKERDFNKDEKLDLYSEIFVRKNFNQYMKLIDTLTENINSWKMIFIISEEQIDLISNIHTKIEKEMEQCKYLMDYALENQLHDHFRCLNKSYLKLLRECTYLDDFIRNSKTKLLMIKSRNNKI